MKYYQLTLIGSDGDELIQGVRVTDDVDVSVSEPNGVRIWRRGGWILIPWNRVIEVRFIEDGTPPKTPSMFPGGFNWMEVGK